MSFFEDLQWRGLVHDVTDPALPALLDAGGLVVYGGFDPTGDSLHIGNLMQMCMLRRLQEAGHQAIALVGGATGMIGDPGGRSTERSLLSSDELAANLAGIETQLAAFLPGATFVNNAEWLRVVTLLDFLRDVGKHFTVNQMVAKEAVAARFKGRDTGISYTEFSYMLLQAADYLHLFDTEGCRLQIGGSDQWGNITMGIDLIRRVRGKVAYGLVTPLVLTSAGDKMGKSEGNAVLLDPAQTSPFALYQYFIRVEDDLVGPYLRYFTWLDHDRIDELGRATAERPEERQGQSALAYELTTLVHGEAEAKRAREAAGVLFSENIAGLDEATLLDLFGATPSTSLSREPVALVDALAISRLCSSKSDARRQLAAGGIYVNNRREADVERVIDPATDALHSRYVILRRGKANHHLLRFA